jgi:hypothetical protein
VIPSADSKVTDSQGWLGDRFRLITGNVAVVGAILYAYVTYVGLVYSVGLYWIIGINPLSFFETTDFLLAGLRHPVVLVLPVFAAFYYGWFSLVASSESKGVSSPSDRRRDIARGLGIAAFVGVLTAVFLPMGASYYVGRHAHDCGQPAQIYLRKDSLGEQQPGKPLSRSIIGSTQKFLLLDEVQSDPAYSVLPIEIVAEIVVRDLPARRPIYCLLFL